MTPCHHSLHVIPTGNGNFSVRKAGSNYGNRVVLKLGTGDAETEVDCTCKFIVRFKIPCCDIIAVGRREYPCLPFVLLVSAVFARGSFWPSKLPYQS